MVFQSTTTTMITPLIYSTTIIGHSLPSLDGSFDASVKLGKLSIRGEKLTRNGFEDMLASVEGGKHNYDWLLTPLEPQFFYHQKVKHNYPWHLQEEV